MADWIELEEFSKRIKEKNPVLSNRGHSTRITFLFLSTKFISSRESGICPEEETFEWQFFSEAGNRKSKKVFNTKQYWSMHLSQFASFVYCHRQNPFYNKNK